MNKTLQLLLLSAAISTNAYSADKELIIASWLPTNHSVNETFLAKVIDEIESRTDGRVTARIEYDLAPPNGLLELIEYGGADISWTYNGYFPGRFVTTKLIELPGYEGNSEAASAAHWRAHEQYLKDADEFAGVELIGLFTHRPASLLMNKEINSLKDIKGRKIRTGGGVANDVANHLGVSPILAPASKAYEMISGGMADGTLLPTGMIPIYRLYEVTPYVYDLPGGFYRGSFSVFMNEDALADISAEDEAAIREYFGEPLSADAGHAWDLAYDKGAQSQTEHGAIKMLSQEDIDYMTTISDDIKESVIAEINEHGVDGNAAYDLIVETMQEYSDK